MKTKPTVNNRRNRRKPLAEILKTSTFREPCWEMCITNRTTFLCIEHASNKISTSC